MKKKIYALLLTFALLVSLAACGGNNAASAPETADPAANSVSDTSAQPDGSAEQSELFHLKIAYSPSICQAPLHIAVEKGFFEAEGIDAENIQVDAAHVQEAVGAEQVDVGFGLIGKFLQPLENGLPIQFTAGIHTGCIKIIAPADSGISSIVDLKGKRIGVSGLAGAETVIAKRALAAEGISVDEKAPDVEFVVFSKNDLGQALQNGVIDVISIGDPTASQFQQEYGLNVILDTSATEPYASEYCCASFVSNKLAQEHPEIAAAFTRAILKASVWVDQNPKEAAQIQIDKNYVTGDVDFNASLLEHYSYIPSVQGGYEAIQTSVQQLTDIGLLKSGTDAKAFTDNCYTFFDNVPDTYSVEESAAPQEN